MKPRGTVSGRFGGFALGHLAVSLVGTALMQEGQPGAALRRLLRGREEGHHAA